MGVAKYVLGLAVIVFALSIYEAKSICSLPPVGGPCKGNFRRWYYNAKSGKCERFVYGGCKGNNNRFQSKRACQRRCGRSICHLPIVGGPCKARIPAWGYNGKSNTCIKFTYGGCHGNANRFPSLASCNRHCVDICRLPKEPGPCRGSIDRWYYDSKKNRCLKFVYGGCKGNRNNFKSKAACNARC